jgi:hypothetical protein
MTATVTRTARGHDLSLVVCRDSTGPGQLHYTRRREADLVVLSAGKPVWQWSAGHEDVADQHVLSVDAEGCWTWTAPWTDVDGRGRGLEPGDYTLAVSTPASELRAFDGQEVAFSIN